MAFGTNRCPGNYADQSGTVADTINKATPALSIPAGTAYTYNGSPQTPAVTPDVSRTVTNVRYNGASTVPGNAGTYAVTADFTPDDTADYNSLSGVPAGSFVINKADASCTVAAITGLVYNGSPQQTAQGSCTGVLGEPLNVSRRQSIVKSFTAVSGLDLSQTSHTHAGSYPGDPWTFTDPAGNYNSTSGTVDDSIAATPVTATAGSLNSTYTGNPQPISGCSVTGPYTGNLACSNTAPYETSAGSGTVTPTINYNGDSSSDYIVTPVNGSWIIAKATATITVTGYSGTYDGGQHCASGTATGVFGENLNSDLNLAATCHTNAGHYLSDLWQFTDPAGNYKFSSNRVGALIKKATPTVIVTPLRVVYDGQPHHAEVTVTGVGIDGDLNPGDANVTYTAHTDAGNY